MPFRTIPSRDLPARIAALPRRASLTLIGLDGRALRDLIAVAPPRAAPPRASRASLLLDLAPGLQVDALVERILDDLADLALARWPDWGEGLPASPEWRRRAEARAARGLRPRVAAAARDLELESLAGVAEPAGLALLAELDALRPHRAAPVVHALERCAARGAAVVYLCPEAPEPGPPYDRILFDALEVSRPEPVPVSDRLLAGRGDAHGGSPTERRVRDALLGEDDLAPLFEFNRTVETGSPGLSPRVDALWREGRVVIEIDGPEHAQPAVYGVDRHRDYALTVAGYLVLRITNGEVATDLGRAIEKIRGMVRFRRSQTRGGEGP